METLSLAMLLLVAIGAVCALQLLRLLRIKFVTRQWIRRIPVDSGVRWAGAGTVGPCRYS